MQNNPKKILFYTGGSRDFETTSMYMLSEISKVYQVVLLADPLHKTTEDLLQDKSIFGNIEKVIRVQVPTGNILVKNHYWHRLAKEVVFGSDAGVLIAPSDMYPIFQVYLMRMAKRKRMIRIAIQTLSIWQSEKIAKWIDLTNAYLKMPSFLPRWVNLALVKVRKYAGHVVYYVVLPLLAFEIPLLGKSSFMTKKGISGMRDANFQTAFSERDYNIFKEEGVKEEKLYILPHPLTRPACRALSSRLYQEPSQPGKDHILIFLPSEIKLGFNKDTFSLISFDERKKIWKKNIREIQNIFGNTPIIMKPHPDTDNLQEIKNLSGKFEAVTILDPKESANAYVKNSKLIIGFEPSLSTTLFSALLSYPEKPIISLNTVDEFYGDFYESFEGIEYVKDDQAFLTVLKAINDGTYQKKGLRHSNSLVKKELKNSVDMLDTFLTIKKS